MRTVQAVRLGSAAMTDRLPEELVYAAHKGEVPCILALAPEACKESAAFLVRVVHAKSGTPMCNSPVRTPFCAEHKRMLLHALKGFWADLMPPKPCEECGERPVIAEVKSIDGGT